MLSMVIPVYNVERYLRECVDSVLRQTYTDWECILVDDGSTDASGAICDGYAAQDDRVRVIHQANGGPSSARKAGIRASRGDCLTFLDSDDWIDEDLFQRLLEPMERDPEIGMTIPSIYFEEAGESQPAYAAAHECAVMDARETARRMFGLQGFSWGMPGKIYRRRFFDDEAFLAAWPPAYAEDAYINYHIVRQIRKAVYRPKTRYHYRMHDESLCHHSTANRMDALPIYDEILEENRERDPQLYHAALFSVMGLIYPMIVTFLEDGTYEDNIEAVWRYLRRWKLDAEMMKKWFPYQRWDFYVGQTAASYRARKEAWERDIVRFAQSASRLYLYGAGGIGAYFDRWLSELPVTVTAFLETRPGKETFRGKPVLPADAIAGDAGAVVLVTMNERHTKEVLPHLRATGIRSVMEGWKMCPLG